MEKTLKKAGDQYTAREHQKGAQDGRHPVKGDHRSMVPPGKREKDDAHGNKKAGPAKTRC